MCEGSGGGGESWSRVRGGGGGTVINQCHPLPRSVAS